MKERIQIVIRGLLDSIKVFILIFSWIIRKGVICGSVNKGLTV